MIVSRAWAVLGLGVQEDDRAPLGAAQDPADHRPGVVGVPVLGIDVPQDGVGEGRPSRRGQDLAVIGPVGRAEIGGGGRPGHVPPRRFVAEHAVEGLTEAHGGEVDVAHGVAADAHAVGGHRAAGHVGEPTHVLAVAEEGGPGVQSVEGAQHGGPGGLVVAVVDGDRDPASGPRHLTDPLGGDDPVDPEGDRSPARVAGGVADHDLGLVETDGEGPGPGVGVPADAVGAGRPTVGRGLVQDPSVPEHPGPHREGTGGVRRGEVLGEGTLAGPRLRRHRTLAQGRRPGVDADRLGGRGRVGGQVDSFDVDHHAPVAGGGPGAVAPLEPAEPHQGDGSRAGGLVGGQVGVAAADGVAHRHRERCVLIHGHPDGQAVQAAVSVRADQRRAERHPHHGGGGVGRSRIGDLGDGRGGDGGRRQAWWRAPRPRSAVPRQRLGRPQRGRSPPRRRPPPTRSFACIACSRLSGCSVTDPGAPDTSTPNCSGARLRCYDPSIRRRNGEW